MTFVNHNQSVVLLGQVTDFVNRSYVAVHGEYTVGYDDAVTLFLGSFQLGFQISHVGVGIAVTLGFAKTHAVNDGSVVQSVGNDGVVSRQQRFEHTTVGVETSCVENGIFSLEEFADGSFQFFVNVLRTADKANG